MFVRTPQDVEALGQVREMPHIKTRSARYLTAADGLGFSYHLNHVGAGSQAHLWYKHHWEANYIISGRGKLTDKSSGETWPLEPGTLYIVGPNDRHIFEITQDEQHASIFCPALRGDEAHDEDGAYAASGPIEPTDRRMFVLTVDAMCAEGKEMVVANGKARTLRMLTKADGLGFSFSDVHFNAGATTDLWYKNHWEGNYIVSGKGQVEDLTTGEIWELAPGMLYNVGPKDRHRVTALTDLHILSVFCPALQGDEQHDADGALEPSGPVPPGPPGY